MTFRESLTEDRGPEGLAGDGRANWIWLAESMSGGRALEIRCDAGRLGPSLRCVFESVVEERWDGRRIERTGASFDVVVIHAPDAVHVRAEQLLLDECRRLLRKGGWLYVVRRNPLWLGALRRLALKAPLSSRRLRAAGFPVVREYYTIPSPDRPLSIIPASHAAAVAHERHQARIALQFRRRVWVAQIGLQHLLYPSLLLLALAD